jgi:hypothetical protein
MRPKWRRSRSCGQRGGVPVNTAHPKGIEAPAGQNGEMPCSASLYRTQVQGAASKARSETVQLEQSGEGPCGQQMFQCMEAACGRMRHRPVKRLPWQMSADGCKGKCLQAPAKPGGQGRFSKRPAQRSKGLPAQCLAGPSGSGLRHGA